MFIDPFVFKDKPIICLSCSFLLCLLSLQPPVQLFCSFGSMNNALIQSQWLLPRAADVQILLKSVRKQCKKGFKVIEQPLALFVQLVNGTYPFLPICEFNLIFAALTRMRVYSTVIQLSCHLESTFGVRPNEYSFSIYIGCYCRLGRPDLGLSLLGKMMKLGREPNRVIFNGLLYGVVNLVRKIDDGVCENGEKLRNEKLVAKAMHLVRDMVGHRIVPNVVCCTDLVRGLHNLDRWDEGKSVLNEVLGIGFANAARRWSMLVHRFCKEGMLEQAEYVVNVLRDRGEGLDTVTYSVLMDEYCMRGRVREAWRVFDQMKGSGFQPDIVCFNILINGLCKTRDVKAALVLFKEIGSTGFSPDTITYSILMDGLFKVDQPENAKKLLKEMLSHGLSPDIVTLGSLLRGLCYSGRLREAFLVWRVLEKKGLLPNIVVYNILIGGLCNCGLIEVAGELFARLPTKNMRPTGHTYTILVKGLCEHDALDEAFTLLDKMVESGCSSNIAPYGAVINYVYGKLQRCQTIGPSLKEKLYGLLGCNRINDHLRKLIGKCLQYDI